MADVQSKSQPFLPPVSFANPFAACVALHTVTRISTFAGSAGYKYFGAARDLPGVRELFDKPTAGPAKRTRYEMHKGVTPDYYGYRDDDDGVLAKYERKAEAKIRKKVCIWGCVNAFAERVSICKCVCRCSARFGLE